MTERYELRLSEHQRILLESPGGRMDAYYYDLVRTGVPAVDRILSALAWAGKGAHHTEAWVEELDYEYGPVPLGQTFIDVIQAAANEAANDFMNIGKTPEGHSCPPQRLVFKMDGGRGALLCPDCRRIVGYMPDGWIPETKGEAS